MVGILIYVLIVVLLVWAALYITERTLPGDIQFPVRIVIGVLGLIAILVKLLPMAGVG